jgi:hypothetical protein
MATMAADGLHAKQSLSTQIVGVQLTALGGLGQQHDGGEGLEPKLVGGKLALSIRLELGDRHVAALQLLGEHRVLRLERLAELAPGRVQRHKRVLLARALEQRAQLRKTVKKPRTQCKQARQVGTLTVGRRLCCEPS